MRIDMIKENISIFEDNKYLIAKEWVLIARVKDTLLNYSINPSFFEKHFGIKVIEYFINVIKGKEELGQCPVISVMLMFFKNRGISVSDIFIICDGLKEAILTFSIDENILTKELVNEIFYVKTTNFVGVIRDCSYMDIPLVNEGKAKGLLYEELKEKIHEIREDIDKEIRVYDNYIIDNDLAELKDLEGEIDALGALITLSKLSSEYIDEMSANLAKYGHILTTYPIFTNLGEYIKKLSISIKNLNDLILSDKQVNMLSALIESLIHDLIEWRKNLFEIGVSDPNEFDNSIISGVETIVMLLSKKSNQQKSIQSDDSNDMELF